MHTGSISLPVILTLSCGCDRSILATELAILQLLDRWRCVKVTRANGLMGYFVAPFMSAKYAFGIPSSLLAVECFSTRMRPEQ